MISVKQVYGRILMALSRILGVDFAKTADTWIRFRRKLNLRDPKTLADKVSYIELHDRSPLAPKCTDKYAVREYLKEKGYGDLLVPLVGGPWDSVEDVDFSVLPNSFVLKATHGCKMNYIVADKTVFDENKCVAEMRRWMETVYGTYSMEPHYFEIPHRIYAEEYLGDMSSMVDYKFHCLNGEPCFVLVITDRKCNGDAKMQATRYLYDLSWRPIDGIRCDDNEIPGKRNIPKPDSFDKMVEIARKLSKEFKFVRVDLYDINGKVLFGELTFTPAACVFPHFTDKFIEEMGKRLML